MSGVARSFFDAVKTRLEPQFPELGVDEPKNVFEVDRARREVGAPPTTLGQATENAYISTSWGSDEEALGATRGPSDFFAPPSPDEAMGASRGTPTQPGFFNRISDALGTPQMPGAAEIAFPWLSGLSTLNRVRNAAFPGAPEPPRPDFSGLSGAKRARAEFDYEVRTHPENFTYGPSAAIGSLDDVARAAKGFTAGSGRFDPAQFDDISQRIKGLADSGWDANALRRARGALARIKADSANAKGDPQAWLDRRLAREPELQRALAQVIGSPEVPTAVVRTPGGGPPGGGSGASPPSTPGAPELGPTGLHRSRSRATPPEIPNLGNTSGGMTADQIRKIAKQREADARAAEELTRPDGWWRGVKGGEPPNLGNTQGGMTPAEIRAARARRESMDSVIKQSGQAPERTGFGKAAQIAGETARAMKRLMLGGELSAISRQGGRLGAGHPLDSAKAWMGALRRLDPVSIKAFDDASQSSFAGRMFKAAGGSFRDLDEPVGLRDIAQSEWPNKIPVIGKWYQWTERTSMAGLNAQVSNVMDTFLKNNWERIAPNMPPYETVRGMTNFTPNSGVNMDEIAKIARVITVAQGRSPELAQHLGPYMELANSTLLAPHWKVSRVEQAAMDLKALAKIPVKAALRQEIDPISKEIAKNALAYYGSGASLLGLLGAAGVATVGTDPLASNFGRIEAGPVSYDIWGGNAQMARMLARMARGEIHTRNGNVRDIDNLRPLWDWLRSGFDVAPGLAADYLTGETLSGQKFSWKDAIAQRVTAIIAQDIQEALDAEMGVRGILEGGARGVLQAVPAAMIGVGMNRILSPAQQRANDAVGGDFSKASAEEKKAALEKTPGLQAQMDAERAKAAGVVGKVEDIRSSFVETQKILDEKLAENGDKAAWYKATGDNEHDLGILISQEYKASGSRPAKLEAQPNDTPKDWYGRVIAANTDPRDGRTVNWDAVEKWRASLTSEQDKYIDDHTNTRPLTGPAAERAQFKRELRQSGFWEIKDEAWRSLKVPQTLQYETYQDYAQAVGAKAIAPLPDSAPEATKRAAQEAALRKDPIAEAYRARANKIELPWVNLHPELADKAAGFGVFDPTKEQRAMIAARLRS